MKQALKQFGLGVLNSAPVYGFLRRRALSKNPSTILCYHTLRPQGEPLDAWIALGVDDFRAQITMLRKHYDIVPLDDALQPGAAGARPRVALTFDDGEIGLHSHLLPILSAENIPVTVYVATQQIETGRAYWFDRVMNALQAEGAFAVALDGVGRWQIGPGQGKGRWAQISAVLEALKRAEHDRRDALADEIVAQVAGKSAAAFTPLQPMSLAQLKELAANPLVEIGAHTHGHELLDQLPIEEARQSIARSKALLEEWTGQAVRHFAYPNGNHTPELMWALEALGFESSTVLGNKLIDGTADGQALPRIGVGRYDKLARLRLRLVGV